MKYTVLLLSFVLFGCATLPKDTHTEYQKIPTSAGPEDMVLDTVAGAGTARLLISCNDHRLNRTMKGGAPNGDIYVCGLDADSLVAVRMRRAGEPEGMDFHPHGIFLCSDTSQEKHYLYVVSHNLKEEKHPIYKYQVFPDSLLFLQAYQSPLIYSPNSVAALPDGGFYIGNDAGKNGGGIMELLLRLRRSNLVYCDGKDKYVKVASKLAYANGLNIVDNHYLYVGTTRQNRVFRYVIDYEGNLVDRQKIAKVVGADNVRYDGGDLYVAAHLRDLAFWAHLKNPQKLSPTVVYRIDPQGSRTAVYANKGWQISAGATALPYGGYLYIGQVFEPFIIRVPYR